MTYIGTQSLKQGQPLFLRLGDDQTDGSAIKLKISSQESRLLNILLVDISLDEAIVSNWLIVESVTNTIGCNVQSLNLVTK
jgi:hypothetical protein